MTPSPLVQQRREREFEAATTRLQIDGLMQRWAAEDGAADLAESALTRELSALRQRVAKLERDLLNHDGPIIKALVNVLGRFRSELRAEIKAVEATVPKFHGPHEAGRTYPAHSFVVKAGGLWISLERTTAPPGSPSWQLVSKSGESR